MRVPSKIQLSDTIGHGRIAAASIGSLLFVVLVVVSTNASAQFTEQSLDNSYRLDHDALRSDLRQDLYYGDEALPAVYRPAPPVLRFVGTLSPMYINNSRLAADDPESDFYFEPDLSLRLQGTTGPKTSYRLYVRAEANDFANVSDAESAFALAGARLTQSFADWYASVSYEYRHAANGVFVSRANVSNNLNVNLTRYYSRGRLTLSPYFFFGKRFADVPEATRARFDAALGIEYKLAERWALVSTPFYEVNWFDEGSNQGRQDQIFSADLGLRYAISDAISLTTDVVSETRISNFAGRNYDMLQVGAHLDFSF